MHFVGSKGLLCSVFFFFFFSFSFFFLTFQPTFLFCFVFPIVFPIQCRVFPSRRSLRFVNVWLLRFLLSVSDVQPDVVLSIFQLLFHPHWPPPPKPVPFSPPIPHCNLHPHVLPERESPCVCACMCVCERERERERWLICSKKESTDHIRLS